MRKTKTHHFKCDRCGKEYEYQEIGYGDSELCHTFSIEEVPGYPSKHDGLNVVFDVCDECLEEILNSFRFKNF